MFISSHSPAFYGLKDKRDTVRLYYTVQDKLGTAYTPIKSDEDIISADQKMGLLPIVAPYIKEKEEELRTTRAAVANLRELQSHNADTLYVEGETDRRVIQYYLENIATDDIEISVRSDVSAGSTWVRNNLLAWALSPAVEKTNHKAFGMLDNDTAGKLAHGSFIDYMAHTDRKAHEGKVKSSKLQPPPHIRSILKKPSFKIDFALEELFPLQVWEHAKNSGWLVERNLADCIDVSKLPNDKSLAQVVDEEFSQEASVIYVRYRVAERHKANFARYVTEQTDPSIFEGIKMNIDSVVGFMQKGRSK